MFLHLFIDEGPCVEHAMALTVLFPQSKALCRTVHYDERSPAPYRFGLNKFCEMSRCSPVILIRVRSVEPTALQSFRGLDVLGIRYGISAVCIPSLAFRLKNLEAGGLTTHLMRDRYHLMVSLMLRGNLRWNVPIEDGCVSHLV